LITGHGGVEHHFTGRIAFGADGATVENGAIFER
jgi:hypothetical protein